jgi:hypothetical protein
MSTLAELVPMLRERGYTRIIVTGPQRSGTTISAKIIAEELGFEFIREEEVNVDDLELFFQLFRGKDRFVLQAPGLCAFAHLLPGCFVLMRRNLDAIVRSQDRIGWAQHWEGYELGKYFTTLGPIGCVKYYVWEVYQKPKMQDRAYELEYESLKVHRLWLDPDQRAHFHRRQIALDDPGPG